VAPSLPSVLQNSKESPQADKKTATTASPAQL
jgi:hypothetical protein